ncbi:M10 family metallopeptidase C-terminal domain-containing protein [Roseomonas chloroacetimidivorans]|uniref:pectate lyase family protein n=1 Tax=Roseomonas chloroacetimidivorans TaxID=1766656 RepID=UPI003C7278F8
MNGGTTGGAGGSSVTVSTGKELLAAIEKAADSPLTIYVKGEITTANTGADVIDIAGVSNLSIIGAENGAEFDGIGIRVKGGSSNLIFQNLSIHDVNSGPKDAIGIEGGSSNIWIDNNEFYSSTDKGKDYYDGLIDMKRGVEYVTVSDNVFRDHYKVSLNGFSDSDEGGRYVTYNGNLFENVGSRAPSVRDGVAHVYDNYYKDVETSAINMRMGAVGLIENNVFENVKDPIVSLDSEKIGFWELKGNEFTNVTWGKVGSGEASAADGKSTGSYDAPYAYTLEDTSKVKALVTSKAGVGKLGSKADTGTDTAIDVDVGIDKGGDPGTGADVDTSPDTNATPADPTGDAAAVAGTRDADVLKGGATNDVLSGRGGTDDLSGGAGDDKLAGGTSDDVLSGGSGNDTLEGNSGNDLLAGGIGADVLTGGGGRDLFVFMSFEDSLDGSGRDVITDFASNDTIDLSAIDAQASDDGDQAFAFIGSEAFTGEAGELHVVRDGDYFIAEGDVDGDKAADFQIALAGNPSLAASDFIL